MVKTKIEEKRITIGIYESSWRKLIQLKLDKHLRTFDEVLNYLFEKEKKK